LNEGELTLIDIKSETSRGPLPEFFSVGKTGDPPFGPQPSETNKACMNVFNLECKP